MNKLKQQLGVHSFFFFPLCHSKGSKATTATKMLEWLLANVKLTLERSLLTFGRHIIYLSYLNLIELNKSALPANMLLKCDWMESIINKACVCKLRLFLTANFTLPNIMTLSKFYFEMYCQFNIIQWSRKNYTYEREKEQMHSLKHLFFFGNSSLCITKEKTEEPQKHWCWKMKTFFFISVI